MAKRAYRKRRVTRTQRIVYITLFFAFAVLIMLRPTWDSVFHALPGNFEAPLDAINKLEWRKFAFGSNKPGLDAPTFWPYRQTLAYSNLNSIFLAPYAVVSAITSNRIAAFNITYLLFYGLMIGSSYQLMMYFTKRSSASVVGAIAFTFCGLMMEGWNNLSLLSAALLPFLFLLLFKLIDKPSYWLAGLIGVASASLLWSNYAFGLAWYLSAILILVFWILRKKFKPGWRYIGAALLAVGVTALFTLPLVNVLDDVERDTVPAPLTTSAGLKPIDLITPPQESLAYRSFDNLSNPAADTNHRLFNGFVATLLVFLGLLTCIRQWRARRAHSSLPSWNTNVPGANGWHIFTFVFTALLIISLAIGASAMGAEMPLKTLADHSVLFRFVKNPTQFMIVPILVAALLAAFGFRALIANATYDVTAGFLALIFSLLLMTETAATRDWKTFNTNRKTATAVYEYLKTQPAGAVAELPIANIQSPTWMKTETYRSYEALTDKNPRINGYAPRLPVTYREDSRLIARFPEKCSIDRIRELGVRYIILHTTNPVGSEEFPSYTIKETLNDLPAGVSGIKIGSAVLIDLGPPADARPDAKKTNVVCD